MMKAMRSLRAMSIHHENLDDPTPNYEPSPKYEPPAEKSNYVSAVASRRTSFSSHHQVSPVVQEHSMTWNKWTIPEGDQITIYRPAPTDHQRYQYTVNPIPNIPTGGRVILTSASPITIEYPSSPSTSTQTSNLNSSSSPTNDWTTLPACLKDCALCAPSPRQDGQYPFLPIFSQTSNPVLENPFTDQGATRCEDLKSQSPKFCKQGMLHRSQRARTKLHAKLETACEECGWCVPSSREKERSGGERNTERNTEKNNEKDKDRDVTNLPSHSTSRTSVATSHSLPKQTILDASTRSRDPASRELKRSMGGFLSDRFIFESHIAPTVRDHRTLLGCWVCWEHESKWADAMEPDDWWRHMEQHFGDTGEGKDGYRICVGENGWMMKRENCVARGCPRIHS